MSAKRDGKAMVRLFRNVLRAKHPQTPRVTTGDKNGAYPVAIDELREDQRLRAETEGRQSKDLHHCSEQDHRTVKRLVKPRMRFRVVHHSEETFGRDWGNDPDRQRTNERNQPRGQGISSGIHQRNLGSDCLKHYGLSSLRIVIGNCLQHVVYQDIGKWFKTISKNVEMINFTQGFHNAYEMAIERMRAQTSIACNRGIVRNGGKLLKQVRKIQVSCKESLNL